MGQFDQEIDDDGVSLTADPSLDPFGPDLSAALPQMPQRPSIQMPTPPQAPGHGGNLQRIISMALTGLAAGLGPRSAVGQGLVRGPMLADQMQQQDYQQQQVQYRQQQQMAMQQQQIAEQQQRAEEARIAKRAQVLMDLAKAVPSLKTKQDYDRFMDFNGNLLVQSGYRDLNPLMLRGQFKFQPPEAVDVIETHLKKYFDADYVKQRMKDGDFTFLQHDSITPPGLQKMTVMEALKITGMDIQLDGDTSIPLEKLTEGQAAIVAAKEEFFQDTGRKATTSDNPAIYRRAKEMMANKDPEMADLTKELARQRLSDARNKPKPEPGALSAATQRRVDMKTRAFESLPAVKRVQTMAEGAYFVNSLDPNTTNPADDQSLIYAFAKVMDPESVVRETEYETIQRYAQSLSETYGFNAKRVFSNTPFLTPQARKNMKATIMARFGASRAQYENVRKSYTNQINQITGQQDGDSRLTDYGGAFPVDLADETRKLIDGRKKP